MQAGFEGSYSGETGRDVSTRSYGKSSDQGCPLRADYPNNFARQRSDLHPAAASPGATSSLAPAVSLALLLYLAHTIFPTHPLTLSRVYVAHLTAILLFGSLCLRVSVGAVPPGQNTGHFPLPPQPTSGQSFGYNFA